MARPAAKPKKLICLCNEVSQETIEAAILRGCHRMGQIFDATRAGVGACGGSCQPTLKKMIDTYVETGELLKDPRPPRRK
jgi:bacterioferritin-associated ferredoxin